MSGIASTPEGPQGHGSKQSQNDNHGEDAQTGLGGSASGAPKPSEENLSHDKHNSGVAGGK
ncbi:hypothetical protein PYCC9005_004837 [Savitreella phatthalungensis]